MLARMRRVADFGVVSRLTASILQYEGTPIIIIFFEGLVGQPLICSPLILTEAGRSQRSEISLKRICWTHLCARRFLFTFSRPSPRTGAYVLPGAGRARARCRGAFVGARWAGGVRYRVRLLREGSWPLWLAWAGEIVHIGPLPRLPINTKRICLYVTARDLR